MNEKQERIELHGVLAAAVAEAMKVPMEDREHAATEYLTQYGMSEDHARRLARALVSEMPARI